MISKRKHIEHTQCFICKSKDQIGCCSNGSKGAEHSQNTSKIHNNGAQVVKWLERMPYAANPDLILDRGPLLHVISPSLSQISYLSTA